MSLRSLSFLTASLLAISCAADNTRAQSPSLDSDATAARNTISASGVSVVKRLPNSLRAMVQLSGKGGNAEEAMAKLKERRDAAMAQVQTLKADKKDVKFGSPSLAAAQVNRQRQVEMIIARQRSQGKKTPKGLLSPESVTLNCTMTVEWPLAGKTAEEILIESLALKKKVKAAELNGKKEDEKLTPEEEEIVEEIEEAAREQGEDSQAAAEPQFLFVARITDEERQKAFADAFAKAKTSGTELAKAAGAELGPLMAISGGGRGSHNFGEETYGRYSSEYYQRQLFMQQMAEDPEQQSSESVAVEPDSMTFTYSLQAVFMMNK